MATLSVGDRGTQSDPPRRERNRRGDEGKWERGKPKGAENTLMAKNDPDDQSLLVRVNPTLTRFWAQSSRELCVGHNKRRIEYILRSSIRHMLVHVLDFYFVCHPILLPLNIVKFRSVRTVFGLMHMPHHPLK